MLTPIDNLKPRELSDDAVAYHVDMAQTQVRLLFKSSPFVRPLVAAELAAAIAATIHFLNVNSGWWHNVHTGQKLDRDFPQLLMLTVSEIGEGWLGIDKPDDKLPHRPMIEVEIADVMIRAFDWIGAGQFDVGGILASITAGSADVRADIERGDNVAEKLMYMIADLSSIMETHRKIKTTAGELWGLAQLSIGHHATMLLLRCIGFSYALNLDVAGAFCEKLAFNQGRPDHKPENRREEGGKVY